MNRLHVITSGSLVLGFVIAIIITVGDSLSVPGAIGAWAGAFFGSFAQTYAVLGTGWLACKAAQKIGAV